MVPRLRYRWLSHRMRACVLLLSLCRDIIYDNHPCLFCCVVLLYCVVLCARRELTCDMGQMGVHRMAGLSAAGQVAQHAAAVLCWLRAIVAPFRQRRLPLLPGGAASSDLPPAASTVGT
jgi:hypothetical protein